MTTMHVAFVLSFVNVDDFNTNEHFKPLNYAWPAIGTRDEFGDLTDYSDWNNEHIITITNRWEAVRYARLLARYFDCSILVTKDVQFTCEHGMNADNCFGPSHYAA